MKYGALQNGYNFEMSSCSPSWRGPEPKKLAVDGGLVAGRLRVVPVACVVMLDASNT